MMRSLYSGITGLNANKQSMASIGDNVANVSTPGFKSSSLSFANLLNQTTSIIKSSVNSGFTGNEIGNGVEVVGVKIDWAQGPLEASSSATDLSISGVGFFRVDNDLESFYTRAGNFGFDKDGNLLNPAGLNVQGYNLLTNAPPLDPLAPPNPEDVIIDLDIYQNVTVDNDGIIYGIDGTIPQGQPGFGEPVPLFQVAVFEFKNVNGLGKLSGNLWEETIDSGTATHGIPGTGNLGIVNPNSLEVSNVDLATEFVNMITAQRAFQANSRVITTSDEMLAELINIKR